MKKVSRQIEQSKNIVYREVRNKNDFDIDID
jgi:hypothetical protein